MPVPVHGVPRSRVWVDTMTMKEIGTESVSKGDDPKETMKIAHCLRAGAIEC